MLIKAEFNSYDEMIQFCYEMVSKEESVAAAAKPELAVPVVTAAVPVVTAAAPDPVQTPKAPDPEPAPVVHTVTRQDVQTKAIALMDAGKQAQLQELLKKYGVPALPSIPEDQLPAFMADLEVI